MADMLTCWHAVPCCALLCPAAGEDPHTGIVAGITPGNPTLVTTVEDERLEFQDGELWRVVSRICGVD